MIISLYKTLIILTLIGFAFNVKITLVINPGEMRCVGEFIPKNEHMDFSYMVEDDTKPVSMTVKIFNGTRVIKEIKDTPIYSKIFKLNRTQALKMCVLNHMKEDLIFPAQLKYGSDINDFSTIVTEKHNEALSNAVGVLETEVNSTSSGEKFLENEMRQINRRSTIQNIIVSFTGYAIGVIFIIGCAQVAFLKHQLKMKKII